ncbi:MAG: DNA topoisomerase IV subunit B [Candidatus Levybacteria bacterium]|nr:DNA topoisomerase IV subunit B [Candidatus Levybacteria bacterium]
MAKSSDYSAAQIQVLEGLEPVRKRPGMYIGSTDVTGLHESLREIIDNSVDEALAGFAKNVWIVLNDDGSATVADDGRGIPIDIMPQYKKSALEIVMTKLHAGGKFGGSAYKISGGLHGVGASVVNALSEWMWVEVKRGGKVYTQEYSRGLVKTKLDTVNKSRLDHDFIHGRDSGNLTSFLPDTKIFSTTEFDFDTIKKAIRERAYLVPNLYFHFYDHRKGKEQEVNYYFEGGITSLISKLNENKQGLHKVIFIEKQEGDVNVEVALQFNDSYAENVESYVNVINTVNGGTHLTGFRMALTRAVNDYGKKIGSFKEEEDSITGDDTREGLTAVVYVKMPQDRIQFEGQTKGKLGNAEIQPVVQSIVKEGLSTYFEENPQDGRRILEKVYLAAKARLAAKAAKEAILRKGALEGSTLPGKLADCQEKDPSISEIFLVEGDSAGGCFSEDTKVALTDGRNVTFKRLIKEGIEGKKNYCYTIKNDGNIGIEEIINPRRTKQNAKVIKLTLDNGEEIICTLDHKFMLRSGEYKEAKDLIDTDSLMPFYKPYSRIGRNEKFQPIFLTYNHKILKIEKVKEKMDVYDIEVPNTNNFALSSGVFVHNSAKGGRDRKFQAILPLKGKILNTERARLDKIIEHEEVKNLIIALGMGIGETIKFEKLRYHRIIIMTDADVDGEHIETLILTFFYRHMPEVIKEGFLYIAMPPLYKISAGKDARYAYSDEEKDEITKEIQKVNTKNVINIQRYKGLGEMNPQQLWETTMDPQNRILKQVGIDDAEEADAVFTMLMGDEVPPRKHFIQSNAKQATLDV